MSDSARQAWKRWWDDEGSGIQPSIAQSDEDFARYITEIAWSNGAYARSAEIDRLRAELAAAIEQRDEARRDWCESMFARFSAVGKKVSAEEFAAKRGWDCFKEGGGA